MCSRFELNSPAREITARFGLIMPAPNLPGPVVRPTDPALAITLSGPRLLRFGIEAPWSKRPLINARVETLGQRATFQRLLDRRCLIPATSWTEWQDAGPGRKKPMWRLRPAESTLFAFAGLVDGEGFVILTCAAPQAIAAIHDRMPVVLPAAWEQAWLDPGKSFPEVTAALAPLAGPIDAQPAEAKPAAPLTLPFND